MDELLSRVRRSFETIADGYARLFADELDSKPFDQDLLREFAACASAPAIDVGCGPGQVGQFLTEAGLPMIGVDFSSPSMLAGKAFWPSMPFVASDARRLPFADGSLNAICSFYCLIYGDDSAALDALREFRRVSAPGARLLIAVHGGDKDEHFAEWNGQSIDITMHYYTPERFTSVVSEAGFAVDDVRTRAPYKSEHPTQRIYVLATVRD